MALTTALFRGSAARMPTERSDIDDTFPMAYRCVALESIPGSGTPLFCYPGAHANCHVKGPIYEIAPDSDGCGLWVGSFAAGDLSPNAHTGVYSCPSPNHVLVVAQGEAYIVNTHDPLEFHHLNLIPVMGVVQVPVAGVTVLYDFTRLEAYGVGGRR